jgi:hypothetical protein
MTGGKIPDKASVCCFHGIPRPHEMLKGWVPEVWRIGGLVRAELDKICNTERRSLLRTSSWLAGAISTGSILARHMTATRSLSAAGLRWTITKTPSAGASRSGQTVWALNGSAAWLRGRGITA